MPNPNITKAITTLIQNQPFYAALALCLIQHEGGAHTISTDGDYLYYNKEWVEGLLPDQLVGVIVHEVMHCAFLHHTRKGYRDNEVWNIACDLAINPLILNAGFQLPKDALLDKAYLDLGVEEIYHRLKHATPKSSNTPQVQPANVGQSLTSPSPLGKPGGGQGRVGVSKGSGHPLNGAVAGHGNGLAKACAWGGVQQIGRAGNSAVAAHSAARWQRHVLTGLAVAKARGAGNVPGELESLLRAAQQNRIDWREQLHRFINNCSRIDYSWSKPNKRMLSHGFVVPGTIPDGIHKLGVVIDTSGSIADDLAKKFLSEIQTAIEMGAVSELIIVQCDTKVRNITRLYGNATDWVDSLLIQGRGGTMFNPALKWFFEHEPDVAALIYFTDLQCSDFGPDPQIPVIWAAYGQESELNKLAANIPFGEVIKVLEY